MDVSETLRLRATEIVKMKKAALIKSDLEPMLASKGKDIMSILCTYDVQSITSPRNSSLPLSTHSEIQHDGDRVGEDQ